MHRVTLKTAPELVRIIRAAAPDYRKREAVLMARDAVTISGTYWDGGSRSTYHAVDLATLRQLPAPQYAPPQFGGPTTDPTVAIPEGVAIVETGVFMGKPATARVYLNPANMAKLIGA
jgi:hypothetical protein